VSDERAKNVLELFEAALAVPEHERLQWIDANCGQDADLAAEVRSLLAAHNDRFEFLDSGSVSLRTYHAANNTNESPSLSGQQVGDFLIEKQIGAGGMGLVYRARQLSLKRSVALKVLPHHLHYSESARARFGREIEAAARLHHRNIVAVFTTGAESGTIYYAMEFIEGPSLSQVIEALRGQPLPELEPCQLMPPNASRSVTSTHALAGDVTPLPDATRNGIDLSMLTTAGGYFRSIAILLAEVADGVQYAHDAQVIHRDIKPSNLLLSRDGRIYVSDFGLARLAEEPGLTRTGEFLGTPFYMAPEQISATDGAIDERTDVYALGATLYELLTLRPPLFGDRREQVVSKILREEPISPRSLNRLVPHDLDTICLKALEKQPARRYPSAGAMANDLRLFAEGLSISAKPTSAIGRGFKWIERHRTLAATVAGMCVLFVAMLFFAYRTRVAESRWTDAEFSRVYETAQLAALEGNLQRAGEAIGEAENLGAPPAQLALLRGQLDFHSGKFQEACNHLELAVRDMPDSLAAHALLTNAYGANEQHEKRVKAASHLADLQPSTLQDYLLLAEAQSYSDFSKARATLDEAVGHHKTSVVARLTRGGVLVYRALETADAELAEAAIDDLRIAGELLEPNAFLLGRMMQARLVAAAAYESADDPEDRQTHLAQAALTADELKRFPGQYQAHLWRAAYFDYVGDDEHAIEEWLANKDHSITFLVLTLFRLERYQEAMELCEERRARYPGARFTEFFRSFVLSGMTESPQEFVAAFEPQGKETLDPLNAHRFSYTIYCLAGNLDAAQQYSRNVRTSGVRLAQDEGSWRNILDYTCGDLDRDQMLIQVSNSRSALCQAHFLIGMTNLAKGNRKDARKHFHACSNLRINRYVEDFMSRALIAQLDREPTWPQWIRNRESSTTNASID
jgi:serine/threonine protein kinase